MAILYEATLTPSKLELLERWLPAQPWFSGTGSLTKVDAFRFDDPAGEVGIQVFLVRAGNGPLHQVPMTYRSAPVPELSEALIGEMDHSVLGRRWVYDACADPVFVSELVRVVLTGGSEVAEELEVDGRTVIVPTTMSVRGSGDRAAAAPHVDSVNVVDAGTHDSGTIVRAGDAVEVTIRRTLTDASVAAGGATLTGTWGDGESARLAAVRVLSP